MLPPSGGGGLVQNTVQQQPAFTRSETRRRLLRPHSLQPRSPEKRRSTHARTQRPFPSSRCTHLRLEATASVPVPLGVHAVQVALATAKWRCTRSPVAALARFRVRAVAHAGAAQSDDAASGTGSQPHRLLRSPSARLPSANRESTRSVEDQRYLFDEGAWHARLTA